MRAALGNTCTRLYASIGTPDKICDWNAFRDPTRKSRQLYSTRIFISHRRRRESFFVFYMHATECVSKPRILPTKSLFCATGRSNRAMRTTALAAFPQNLR